ncbi:putative sugar transporter [Meira miltonrushii]|uniref:Putative sugar transporter n=1 Tax=Meira miltonrushii TaxID=1280837 RepID=A0A316V1W4_9BASI|nr:putative sugar transporter [Meira miltonrushii]PWN31539.1 putative sugar transporter [Meira miltonrushii]
MKSEYSGRKWMGLSGVRLSFMIGAVASAGFLLLGYDQGVMSGLLTLPSFTETFPQIDTTRNKAGTSSESTLQGLTIGLYEIGCLIGALSCLWLGDLWGRRAVIWVGTIWMVIGAIIQASSFGLPQLIVGRIIGGIGNGMHTATIPMWQSECSPPHKRGKLVMIEGLLITGGICMAYWIDFAFYWLDPNYPHRSAAWRIPIAWQIFLCLPTFLTILMPESPRWLVLKGRTDEAREVIGCLDETSVDDPETIAKVKEIQESLAVAQSKGLSDVFKNGKEKNLHRALLGIVSQAAQQLSGINLITYYAATLFETNLGLSALLSRILAACNGTEYFIASIVAVYTIETFGRRKLMLFGAAGMCITMAILGGLTAPSSLKKTASGEASNKAPAYAAAVFLFVFNTFFAIGWLGMTWLYPAEICPLSIRAAANGLSTASNWIFNFLVVLVTPISFYQIDYGTYLVFMSLNAIIFFVTFFCFPETAGRSLEEMSGIFEKASTRNPYDVVRIEQRTPRRYDKQGQLLVSDEELGQGIFGDEVVQTKEKSADKDSQPDALRVETHDADSPSTRSG